MIKVSISYKLHTWSDIQYPQYETGTWKRHYTKPRLEGTGLTHISRVIRECGTQFSNPVVPPNDDELDLSLLAIPSFLGSRVAKSLCVKFKSRCHLVMPHFGRKKIEYTIYTDYIPYILNRVVETYWTLRTYRRTGPTIGCTHSGLPNLCRAEVAPSTSVNIMSAHSSAKKEKDVTWTAPKERIIWDKLNGKPFLNEDRTCWNHQPRMFMGCTTSLWEGESSKRWSWSFSPIFWSSLDIRICLNRQNQ